MKRLIGVPALHKTACARWKSYAASIMEIELPPDFKEFLKLLDDEGVQYLVIGGYAVAFHGYPRATSDIDIWIAISRDNARRVVAALRAFGFDLPDVSEKPFLEENRIIRMGNPPMRIEISTSISGVDFDKCHAERVIDTIDGIEVSFISLANLRANKKAAGRLKDLSDLENLQ
jgi:hypothetical protein